MPACAATSAFRCIVSRGLYNTPTPHQETFASHLEDGFARHLCDSRRWLYPSALPLWGRLPVPRPRDGLSGCHCLPHGRAYRHRQGPAYEAGRPPAGGSANGCPTPHQWFRLFHRTLDRTELENGKIICLSPVDDVGERSLSPHRRAVGSCGLRRTARLQLEHGERTDYGQGGVRFSGQGARE